MSRDFTLRTFHFGDEAQTAVLFNRAAQDYLGPFTVTPESWLEQYRRRTWRGPGIEEDPECVRIVERDGQILGHCVTDYGGRDHAQVMELCVEPGPEAEEVAQALLEDAEAMALAREKFLLTLNLSPEDGFVADLCRRLGYEFAPTGAVFMTLITDLAGFLRELQPELTRRLQSSPLAAHFPTLLLQCGEMQAGLRVQDGQVEVADVTQPQITFAFSPETLPLVLFGHTDVAEAYLQDHLHMHAEDKGQALRVLEILFPRRAMYLPRVQWW